MEKHQRNATANGKIMNYLEQTFLYPTDFDTVLYASQLLQAEAIRYGIEHFRRAPGPVHGNHRVAAQRLLAGSQLVLH